MYNHPAYNAVQVFVVLEAIKALAFFSTEGLLLGDKLLRDRVFAHLSDGATVSLPVINRQASTNFRGRLF